MSLENIVRQLREKFPQAIISETAFRGETSLTVQVSEFREICRYCQDQLGFDYLIDISSVDHYGDDPRFELVYELYSLKDQHHLRLKYWLAEDAPEGPTVSDLWPTADWHEREAFDMMGIRFKDHPDLRRILMWDGFPYYPLRKEFPLEGKSTEIPEVAFTHPAPLAGGPFVTLPTDGTTQIREPRARRPEDLPELEKIKFIAEP